MCKILLLVAKCPGPSEGRRWNAAWSDELEEIVTQNYWYTIANGVLVLGAIAKQKGMEVDIVDEEIADIDFLKKYDIVAMYTVTPNILRCYEFAERFRKAGTYVVLGGVHATVCKEEALQHADTVLTGESEYIWDEFLEDYLQSRQKRIYQQPVGTVKLEDSPIPLFEAIPSDYQGMIPIQTARGCPHGCQFCDLRSLYGKSYRQKSISQVQQEIERTLHVNGNRNIYFTDDNLFCMKKRAEELMEMLKPYRLSWVTNTDVSFGLDQGLIKQAATAGCRRVLIGLESVSKKSLTDLDQNNFKSRHRQHYEEAIYNIQSYGIGVIGSFIVGLEEDTEEIFTQIYEFVQKNGLSGVNITVNTPFPGTEMFQIMKNKERIKTFDWSQYTIFQPVIEFNSMTLDCFQEKYAELLMKVNDKEAVIQRKNTIKDSIRRRLENRA